MQDRATISEIYDAVWRYANAIKPRTRVRLIFMALAHYHGQGVTAAELAHATGASVDSTKRTLRKLRAQGAVRSSQVFENGRWAYGWEIRLEGIGVAQACTESQNKCGAQ